MGGITGLYYAIVYRRVYFLFGAMAASGASFGFFMGIGAIIRSEMEGNEQLDKESQLNSSDNDLGMIKRFDPKDGSVFSRSIYE